MSFYRQIKNNIENFLTSTSKVGTTVTYIPVTKTLNGYTGDETLTEGTSESIDCYFTNHYKSENRWFISEEGEVENGDAFILVRSGQDLNKNDIIIYNNRKYRVRNTYNIIVNGEVIGKEGNLFLIE